MKTLYISYDGMTDSLGQSQVLPYLIKLSKLGVNYTLISFEKEQNFIENKEVIEGLVKEAGIKWIPLKYTKRPPVLSTFYDVQKLKKLALKEVEVGEIELVHCRSYISALAGLYLRRKKGIPFIFDMRGFWADERIDGGIWKLSNPLYKKIYDYFKKKEVQFLTESDAVISLTDNGKKEIESWKLKKQAPITVIPCCTDSEHFDKNKIESSQIDSLRKQLAISDDDFVISYLGSIGTWYMLDEMLDFIKVMFDTNAKSKALFITREPKEFVLEKAKKKGVDESKIIIEPANRADVPLMVSLSHASLFFIKPVYSKKASSPTKMGEILNLNIPIVCNSGVGDDDLIMDEILPQYLVKDFSNEEYLRIVKCLLENKTQDNSHLRKYASNYFSLDGGVQKYHSIYKTILSS